MSTGPTPPRRAGTPGFPDGNTSDSQPPAPRRSETILLVEDEEGVRAVVRRALERSGYRVLEAADAAAARLVFAATPAIDLVLTDMVMPGESGRELAEHLRAERPSLKVLFMSGYTDDPILRDAIRGGTEWFIQKPFSPAALTRLVREVLDTPGSHPAR